MTLLFIMIAVAAVAVVAAVVVITRTTRRRNQLREQFGPEYDRAVKEGGNRRVGERDLHDRQDRVEDMGIRPLDPAKRGFYAAEWIRVQERFVDAPEGALADADRLVRGVMADRGYETHKFQRRVADLSVAHGPALAHYREAHDISARAARQDASTEEIRQAMVHYRTLFDDLLADDADDRARTTGQTGGVPLNNDRTGRTPPGLPNTPRKG